ncbi:MAG: hypothetical protein KDJ36_17870 [Hyphomicrobiaceae bacterium]|nr:hypothetical protein [Hyphomicrobiaceae bacterium]
MRSACIAICAALLLSACAKTPESIGPAYVSTFQYQNYSCDQLREEQQRLDVAYATAAAQQQQARRNDTLGVILIGLPVSSLSGDNIAAQIASLKGQQEAVQKTIIEKNCTTS